MTSLKLRSTRVSAFIIYLIPLFYSFLIFLFGFNEFKYKGAFSILYLGICYGTAVTVICIVGCRGIINENATCIRSTIILLIVNNIIMTILITFLFIDIIHSPHIVIIHKASRLLQSVVRNKKVGLTLCFIVYSLIFVSSCFMWTVGDYLAHLDAKLCLDDLRRSHDFIQSKKRNRSYSANTSTGAHANHNEEERYLLINV